MKVRKGPEIHLEDFVGVEIEVGVEQCDFFSFHEDFDYFVSQNSYVDISNLCVGVGVLENQFSSVNVPFTVHDS